MEAPPDLTRPQAALWWLKAGRYTTGPEWDRAHALAQEAEGDFDHDLVHALCHWIEGDAANRDWWYARVAPWTPAASIKDEWDAIQAHLAPPPPEPGPASS